jgi:uncharacterized protein YkwD
VRGLASFLVFALPWLGVAADTAAARAEGKAPVDWAPWSFSPDPSEGGTDPLERALLARCGPGERGLMVSAQRIAASYAAGGAMPDRGAIAFFERAAGEPHPWPEVWVRRASRLDPDASLADLSRWLASEPAEQRRCGVATGTLRDGERVAVVVSADALADLAPLPTRVRVGEWLEVRARLRVHAHGGRVLVLGPSGAPRTLLTSFDGATVRARFAPDAPGAFAVQVLVDRAGGPRPVLEAMVFADVAPSEAPLVAPAPGEEQAAFFSDAGGHDPRDRDADALAAMVAAARATAGLPALVRDSRLDAVARAHAEQMAEGQKLAHDAGDGDPMDRLAAAGISVSAAAENVAHEASVARVHRAVWESPSHRANLLGDYDAMGIAAVRDDRGSVWAVELWTKP